MRLTKKDVVVVALARLDGAAEVIDTEDAAIVAHEIDAAAFGWKKYNDRVDLEVARTSLRHEGEAKDPRLEGSIQNGWHLTPRGVAWITARQELLDSADITVAETSAATQRWRAETRQSGAATNRIVTSDAFRRWSRGLEFTPRQAAEVFRIDEYTPPKDRSRKTAQLQEMTKGDAEIDRFIAAAIPVAMELRVPVARQEEE